MHIKHNVKEYSRWRFWGSAAFLFRAEIRKQKLTPKEIQWQDMKSAQSNS